MKWYYIVLIILVAMALGYGVKYMMDRPVTPPDSDETPEADAEVAARIRI